MNSDLTIMTNSEVVVHITPEHASFGSKDVLDALKFALKSIGMSIIRQNEPNVFRLGFETYEAFRYFHEKVLFHSPIEQGSAGKPFLVKIVYEKIPRDKTMKDVLSIFMVPYKAMGVIVKQMTHSGGFDLYFPNEEAYFITFMKIFLHCDHVRQQLSAQK